MSNYRCNEERGEICINDYNNDYVNNIDKNNRRHDNKKYIKETNNKINKTLNDINDFNLDNIDNLNSNKRDNLDYKRIMENNQRLKNK